MEDTTNEFPTLGSVYKTSGNGVSALNQSKVREDIGRVQPVSGEVNMCDSKTITPWLAQTNAWGVPKVIGNLGLQSDKLTTMEFGAEWETKTADFGSTINDRTVWHQPANETFGNGSLLNSLQDDNFKAEDVDRDSSDSEVIYGSDDTDDFDSDSDDSNCDDSHEKHKKNKWFFLFFDSLDGLTVEDISSESRQWHCPACQEGPGAIAWYRGLQPLIIHTKTKTTRRPRVHCRFSELLDEEVHRRGISLAVASEALDRWEGLNESVKDYQIVWPPIVIIMNTRCERDDNDKWKGMGSQELLDYFASYAAVKARHSYGPQGHSGMSALIFEGSAAGYLEALRLHNHFREQGRDRKAWDCSRVTFCPGAKRQLYGFMASKEDLAIFNQHSKGKPTLKYEMKSYKEMVDSQIKHINEDNQQLTYLKDKFDKEQKEKKALAEFLRQVSLKLQRTANQTEIVMQHTKLLYQQSKEELDAQEQFFKEQIDTISQAMELKEANFDELLRAATEKAKHLSFNLEIEEEEHGWSSIQENTRAAELLGKDIEGFEQEREELKRSIQERRSLMTQKYWEERIELEKELETRLSLLMEKYAPTPTGLAEEETANGTSHGN